MPIGFPAVTPIRDRSEVALRVEQIRQRLSAIDAELTRLGSVADASAVAARITSLALAMQQLSLRLTALEGEGGTSDTLTLPAGELIVSGQVVVPGGPNQCLVADPSDPRARNTVLGVARNGGAAGQAITIQRRGQMTISGAAFETGRPVFLGLAGTITQDPTYASAAVVVGVAMSATVMWLGAGDPTLLAPTNYPDPFDDAMPVSWGVVAPYLWALDAGDVLNEDPGDDLLYGTNSSGVKGWYPQASGSGLTQAQVLARSLGA